MLTASSTAAQLGTQQRTHPGIELGELAIEMRREPPVQMAAPAQRAVDDLRAERRVAGVQPRPLERVLERDVGEGAIALHPDQDVQGLVPGLRDRAGLEDRTHGTGSLTRAPG
jgi:hypothetical protein